MQDTDEDLAEAETHVATNILSAKGSRTLHNRHLQAPVFKVDKPQPT